MPGDDGHSALPVHPILLLPHRHGLTRETPRHIRPEADNLSPGRQGLHQLHLQPQLPCGQAVLAAEQQEGGQVDGHLLPPHLRQGRPGERHPRPQLPRPPRALPGPGAGALGHLQGRHASDPRDGDPHGENSPAGLHPGPAAISPGRLGGQQWRPPPARALLRASHCDSSQPPPAPAPPNTSVMFYIKTFNIRLATFCGKELCFQRQQKLKCC